MTVDAFVERMRGLAGGTLARFDERVAGCEIRVFGAVAVASVACEAVENGTERTANVEMMLLVKDDGRWRIVAQAWDRATKDRPLPDDLVRDSGDGGA